MKKVFYLLLFTIISSTAFAQIGSVEYREVKDYLNNLGFKITNELYADLAQDESTEHVATFSSDKDYILIGMSDDEDVNDVDIYLYTMDDDVFEKDTDETNVAVITFEPKFTRKMKVIVTNFDSDTPGYESRCRILIAEKRR